VALRRAWLAIEEQFLGNREACTLRHDAEFHVFMEDGLSVSDYCRKMKGVDEVLGDLGEVIHDRTLLLNVLCGLNERFAHINVHFKRSNPFPPSPTFAMISSLRRSTPARLLHL
jgi:hypothetical protein